MSSNLHVALLAGEASGDTLGAGLMRGLLDIHPDITFTGIGGSQMEACGLQSMVPMERLAVMGLVEPLKRLPELLGIRKQVYQTLTTNPPDVFVGIDSPDFNLALEKKLKAAGIPTVHYVSPSVWAWRQGRLKTIKQAVNRMLTLFPFEEDFYIKHDIPVSCVGHPLADEFPMESDTAAARDELGLSQDALILAMLPGSRGGEVSRLGPVFLDTAKRCQEVWSDMQFVIPCAGQDRKQQMTHLLEGPYGELDITLVDGNSRTVMAAADCLLMASGTATLEGLLLKKPMVVAYKMAALSYAIISRMLKAPYVSLPNLLAGKALVPELLQGAAHPQALFEEIQCILGSDNNRQDIIATWQGIHHSLRRNANTTAAKAVLDVCKR